MNEQPVEAVGQGLPDLAALLQRGRDVLQRSLVAAAEEREAVEQRLLDVRAAAEDLAKSFDPTQGLLQRYAKSWSLHGEKGGPRTIAGIVPSSLDDAQRQWEAADLSCRRLLSRFRADRSEYDEQSRKRFRRKLEPPTLPQEFRVELWNMKAVLDALPSLRVEAAEQAVGGAADAFAAEVRLTAIDRKNETDGVLRQIEDEIKRGVEVLGDRGLDWPAVLAKPWYELPWTDPRLRLGAYAVTSPGSRLNDVPCVIPFPGKRSLALVAPAEYRHAAIELARSIVLRVLSGSPPGNTEITFVDPVALGGSIADFLHLGDFDPRLVDTQPRTSQADIETRLTEVAAHVERVISKYLRGQFTSLAEYNEMAGEMAESQRLLVVFDFPTQFSDRAAEQLLSIIENGPRCGVNTVLLLDPAREMPNGVPLDRILDSMDKLTWSGEQADLAVVGTQRPEKIFPDSCPPIIFDSSSRPQSPAAALLRTIGEAAREADHEVVDFERTFQLVARIAESGLSTRLPVTSPGAEPVTPAVSETWWPGTTQSGATALIGRTGANDVAALHFSSTDIAGGAIMVGLPRSGKTTSLHAAILSMCMYYSPEELELFLIDAKHGVEFNAYRELPHARMVAVNREREFAVAVLQSLDKEIERRAELMKRIAPGRTNLDDFRAATGETMARIVVIVDEFHEIFEEDDRMGQAAFEAFSNIVRQGPFAGVHVVLASQTLSSMPAMDRSTLLLLPIRVAFACNESDAQIVLGDDNPAARYLEQAGEGVLNAHRGSPANNQKFMGIYVNPDDRGSIVEGLVQKAASEGYSRRPRVFDGDAMASRRRVEPAKFFNPDGRKNRISGLIGEPLTLDPQLYISMRRDQHANVLIVANTDDDGLPSAGAIGVFHSLLLGAGAQAQRVEIIDYLNDEGLPDSLSLEELAEHFDLGYHRRAKGPSIIRGLATVVRERVTLDDYKSGAIVLAIAGLDRATDIDIDSFADDEDDEPLAEALTTVLRDGPEVGVHTIVIAREGAAVARRLGDRSLEYFGFRAVGKLRGDTERQTVLEDFRSSDIRGSQMLLFDRTTERRAKFQPYGPVSEAWADLASLDATLDATAPEAETK